MKMDFAPQVPAGMYPGSFDGVEETNHEEYGEGARWDFVIEGGEYDGVTVSRTTKAKATKKNSCGKFFMAVSGLPLDEAVAHDTDDFVGAGGNVIVEDSPSGESTRVVTFVRDKQQQSANFPTT